MTQDLGYMRVSSSWHGLVDERHCYNVNGPARRLIKLGMLFASSFINIRVGDQATLYIVIGIESFTFDDMYWRSVALLTDVTVSLFISGGDAHSKYGLVTYV